MVRTTKGSAEKSKPKVAPEKMTAEDRKVQATNDIEPEVWARIVEMGKSQQVDPSEVVKRAINQVYGEPATSGPVYHSGNPA